MTLALETTPERQSDKSTRAMKRFTAAHVCAVPPSHCVEIDREAASRSIAKIV